MKSLRELKKQTDVPIVLSNRNGVVTYVNDCFLYTYKWGIDLIGSSLTRIIPTHYHDSHNMGFSRFLVTGQSHIAHHLIEAQVIMGNGQPCRSHHLIIVEKIEGDVVIGAMLTPTEDPETILPSDHQKNLYRSSQTIDELRTTMGKMELALGNVPDAIIWTDDSGKIHWCNEAFDRLVQRDHLSILGQNVLQLINISSKNNKKELEARGFKSFVDDCAEHTDFQAQINGNQEILEISSSNIIVSYQQQSVVLVIRIVTKQRQMTDALAASRKRMVRELEFGREIQMNLLPISLQANPMFSLHADMKPALEVGGDFYDYFLIDNKFMYFCIGDVVGKGVPAAILAAAVQTMARNHCSNTRNPSEIIAHVNRQVCARNQANMFISLIVGILDLKSGRLHFCNAGHNLPFLRKSDQVLYTLKDKHGPVLGISLHVEYGESVVEMASDDAFFAYTDGVTEAMDASGQLYTIQRLRNAMEAVDWKHSQKVIDTVNEDIHRFVGQCDQADDITLFCLIFHGQQFDFQI